MIGEFASRLIDRRLFKAIDLHPLIEAELAGANAAEEDRLFRRRQEEVTERIAEWVDVSERRGRILVDAATRKPSKSIEDEGPMNQIWIRDGTGLVDLQDRSPAVAATRTYRAFRAYVAQDDEEARRLVSSTSPMS